MKSCDGCRYLFEGMLGGQTALFCRALPPFTRFTQQGDSVHMQSHYPLIGKVRCGLFKRPLWPWCKTPSLMK